MEGRAVGTASFRVMNVDWEARIDITRLRADRLRRHDPLTTPDTRKDLPLARTQGDHVALPTLITDGVSARLSQTSADGSGGEVDARLVPPARQSGVGSVVSARDVGKRWQEA